MSEINIQFFFQRAIRLSNKRKLNRFLNSIFKTEGKTLESLSYIFCSDKYLLNINRKFLNHDFYTDIITFDLSDNHLAVNGEIYISVDRVKENARVFKTSFNSEFLRVLFHGALHLCGYNDKTQSQRQKMRKKEIEYLQLYRFM